MHEQVIYWPHDDSVRTLPRRLYRSDHSYPSLHWAVGIADKVIALVSNWIAVPIAVIAGIAYFAASLVASIKLRAKFKAKRLARDETENPKTG
jgi:uncharacterized membrane protein YjjP (DUF1212 family)